MNKFSSPYKELGTAAQTILGASVSEKIEKKKEKQRQYQEEYRQRKNIKEMLEEGKAPGCIGEKTGGKW